jgi:hypothetical protein
MGGVYKNLQHDLMHAVQLHKSKQTTMRKVTLICFFIAGTISMVEAQTIVPKVGVTISTTTVETINSETQSGSISSQSGITFGVGYNVPVTTLGKFMFSLQPEFNYIQKGYKISTAGEIQLGEPSYEYKGQTEFTINYIEIPVLAKFELGSDNLKVAAFAGPSLGFALGGKYHNTFNMDTGNPEDDFRENEGDIIFYRRPTNSDDYDAFDHNIEFGIQAGASITLFRYVSVDVRYGMALTDLIHDTESKNRVFQFTVGVPIRIK